MVKTISLQTKIPANRELRITLPEDVPSGPAEVRVGRLAANATHEKTPDFWRVGQIRILWNVAGSQGHLCQYRFAMQLRKRAWKRSSE